MRPDVTLSRTVGPHAGVLPRFSGISNDSARHDESAGGGVGDAE